MRGFRACVNLHDKFKFIENGLHMDSLLHFLCWRFYRFVFLREVKPFAIWFYPPLLDYDFFLYDLVVLIVLFKTSPRSSKSESGYKGYGRFSFAISVSFALGGMSGRFQPEYSAQLECSAVSCQSVKPWNSLKRLSHPVIHLELWPKSLLGRSVRLVAAGVSGQAELSEAFLPNCPG